MDSSVAAALLVQQGHEVVGLTYNIGSAVGSRQSGVGTPGSGVEKAGGRSTGRCCGIEDAHDAAAVAHRLGIPHYVINVSDRFRTDVIGNFLDSYLAGETPLPCAQCNTRIKWGHMMERAQELGANIIATGHYARVEWRPGRGRFVLLRARDRSKDQSYFLFGLTQQQLARACFPLGDLTKEEVRGRAAELGLCVADKPDSQELCFVSEGRYADTVRSLAPALQAEGEIVDVEGRTLGRHNGYFAFTVGQRRGLGLTGGPHYVTRVEAATRRVSVGSAPGLYADRLEAGDPNLIGYETWDDLGRVRARVRYRHEGEWARVRREGSGLRVDFERPVRAIAPGQAAVFYDGDEVVGGAWIRG